MADSSALRQRIRDGADRAVTRATDALVDQLQADAPYKTGDLYRSIHGATGLGDPLRPSAAVFADAPQAVWTDEGTKPHMIFPLAGRRGWLGGQAMLRFDGRVGVVFARQVSHPGTTGSHWFSNAVSFWSQRVAEQFPAAWDG